MWDGFPRPEAKTIFDAAIGALAGTARRVTEALHNGTLWPRHLSPPCW